MMTFLRRAARFCVLLSLVAVGLGAFPDNLAAADDTARFELTLDITWSRGTAPFEFPDVGHMSGLIGATHNPRYVLFRDGDTASSGLELVAENGRVRTLRAEFAEAERRKRLGTRIDGPELPKVPGRISTRFETTRAHPLLSFVTMIAPSPDWFTGAADVALVNDGSWIDELRIPLWAWDSGTDGGTSYSSKDVDTQPQQSVRLLASPHFLNGNGLVPVGTATVRRLKP